MYKFDLIQLIGTKSCMVASHITQAVASESACSKAEVWNMGALVVSAVVLILVARFIHERRKLYRVTYRR